MLRRMIRSLFALPPLDPHPLLFPPALSAGAQLFDAILMATVLVDSSAAALFPRGGSCGSSAGQIGHGIRVTGGEGVATAAAASNGGGQPGHIPPLVWKRLHIWHIPATAAVGKNKVV